MVRSWKQRAAKRRQRLERFAEQARARALAGDRARDLLILDQLRREPLEREQHRRLGLPRALPTWGVGG